MQVNIKNYQAIKDVELTFDPGITAIVGNSNNGKSSIIRAIEAAINNKGGSGFINYDADECEVTIKDNDVEIKWVKSTKAGKSHYVINGDKVDKIGQKQLPEVGNLLNMSEVEVNNERFRLNFWKQMEYPFLVGKTSYQLFDFISKSDEQDLIKNYQDDSREELKTVSKEVERKSIMIDSMTENIQSTEKEIKGLLPFENFDLDGFKDTLEDYTKLVALINTYEDSSDRIEETTDLIESYDEKIDGLYGLVGKIDKGIRIHAKLAGSIATYNESSKLIKIEAERIAEYDELYETNSTKVGKLGEIISSIESTESEVEKYKSSLDLYETYSQHIERDTNKLEIISKRMSEVEEALSEFDVCPFCGSSLDGSHSHDKEANNG